MRSRRSLFTWTLRVCYIELLLVWSCSVALNIRHLLHQPFLTLFIILRFLVVHQRVPIRGLQERPNRLLHSSIGSAIKMPMYPPIRPFNDGFLKVSQIHSLYFEESGKQDGLPIVYLHGGPGGGCDKDDRRFFDPDTFRAVLFDQRGAGKSTPHAELKENTTWDLVEDIERIRKHLKIDKWIVFGGSWGSTLALAYAETHPEQCLGLILRGIFTLRRKELLWFYQEGADFLFPDLFDAYKKPIPESEDNQCRAIRAAIDTSR